MASYFEWNEAIARFFVEGISSGDALYLSVDEDTLVEIASYAFSEEGLSNPVIDFELAVEEECVSGGRVTLPGTAPQEPSGAPACLAFLSAMVLAAYRMAPESGISEINYQDDCKVFSNPFMASLSNHQWIERASFDKLRMSRHQWPALLCNRPD